MQKVLSVEKVGYKWFVIDQRTREVVAGPFQFRGDAVAAAGLTQATMRHLEKRSR